MKTKNLVLIETFFGRRFYIEQGDIFVQNKLKENKIYEEENLLFLKKIVKQPKLIVDAGVNFGLTIVEYGIWSTKVIGFEPIPHIFKIAKQNIKLNKHLFKNNIILYNTALGSFKGKILMENKLNESGLNKIVPNIFKINKSNLQNVLIDKLDNYNLVPDIIKIDVEGYEKSVLIGSTETIKQHRPILQIEIQKEHLSFFNIKPQEILDYIFINFPNYVITNNKGKKLNKKWKSNYNYIDYFFLPIEKYEELK